MMAQDEVESVNRRRFHLMLGMRWTNWVGFLMLIILLVTHEPIWLLIFSDPADSGYSVNIV